MRKILSFILILTFFQISLKAQEADSIKTALLIVDIQNFYFPGDGRPGLSGAEEASEKAGELLQIFRKNNRLVVHVRHQSNRGFEIHKNVKPLKNEKVITKTEVNSFLNTDLLNYLRTNKINRLVIIGMQTQLCLEAAVRAAHDYGFKCIVVQDACATRDVSFGGRNVKAADVHTAILSAINDGGYADVINLDDFKENSEKYLFQKIK